MSAFWTTTPGLVGSATCKRLRLVAENGVWTRLAPAYPVPVPDLDPGVPLAPLTTLRLGGPARRVVEAATQEELTDAVRDCDARGEPVLVLAGGSNVVIADDGFDGTVVLVRTRGVRRRRAGERALVTAQAGEPWGELVALLIDDGLAGVECLAGIPGSAGATPIQNVGAYGQEVAGTIVSVRVLDRRDGEVRDLAPDQCGFGYRTSVFKHAADHVVLAVTFVLASGGGTGEPVRYAELAGALGVEPGQRAPLAAIRDAVLELRRGKGMLLDAGDHDTWSAGSFFTNPLLDAGAADALDQRVAERLGADVRAPRFPDAGGGVKTSAAWLIEHAGFAKGDRRGAVGISAKHALALTNRGGATTRELLVLAHEIAAGVERDFGVALRPEPVLVGCDWGPGTARPR